MKKLIFNVMGMHCAGCAGNVEKAVRKLDGVDQVYVSIGTKTMNLEADPAKVSPEKIVEAVRKAGYDAELQTKENRDKEVVDEEETQGYFYKFLTALVFGVLLFYVAMHGMLGLPWFDITDRGNAIIQLLLTLPIVVAGFRFYTSGFKSLFRLAPNMDSLIALCTSAAILYSLSVKLSFRNLNISIG